MRTSMLSVCVFLCAPLLCDCRDNNQRVFLHGITLDAGVGSGGYIAMYIRAQKMQYTSN